MSDKRKGSRIWHDVCWNDQRSWTCVREVFLSLSNLCWRMGKVSTAWRRAVIVPFYKGKGSRMHCASYRAISLISKATKVFGKIVERRMRVTSDELLWKARGGIKNNRGCIYQISPSGEHSALRRRCCACSRNAVWTANTGHNDVIWLLDEKLTFECEENKDYGVWTRRSQH